MPRALLASFANRLAIPDLRWVPDEGLTFSRLRIELLSGLTVALALVPEAVAFAFVAGVHPLVGLYAAFIVGLITGVIGGRPGMISGALFAFVTSFDEVVVVLFIADFDQQTIPRQMWNGIREQISPAILSVATILVIFSTLLLTTMELLRRRSERLRGMAPH